MSDIAVRVVGVSKRYRIGAKQEKYKTLRDTLTETALRPFRAMKSLARPNGHSGSLDSQSRIRNAKFDSIWALKDVSFDIKRGEVVGIIGRNGAGKSTLLKILSRITEPTEGYADISGRIASLLEVGTGFHPELTGRENIYLNGSILGMKHAEIQRKFDEIVAFAEIEKFIDTPVKHYSSGMYVRLAFAVTAHLDPEILLVDELLAVGDAAFQKKCMGKMEDVAETGRTVLFVSHNMGAIASLCKRAVLLDSGRVVLATSSAEVISAYLKIGTSKGVGIVELTPVPSDAYFTRITILDEEDKPVGSVLSTSALNILIDYRVLRTIAELDVTFMLYDRRGSIIFYSGLSKSRAAWAESSHEPGSYAAKASIPANFLAPGSYTIGISLHRPNLQRFDRRDNVIRFDIVEAGSSDYKYEGRDIGSILVDLVWELEKKIDPV